MSTSNFELFWITAALLLLSYSIYDSHRSAKLSRHLLFFICGGSLFWQEFYADWGVFLIWNTDFHMMPWGKTLWTIENKPWFNIAAYPVFMWAAFTCISVFLSRVKCADRPLQLLIICAMVAGPTLYGFNVVTEYLAVAKAGLWTYTDTIGPALRTEAGTMPLLYPSIPFAMFAVLLAFLQHYRNAKGQLHIEEVFSKKNLNDRPIAKIFFWILVWNSCYWLALCTPLILIRNFS